MCKESEQPLRELDIKQSKQKTHTAKKYPCIVGFICGIVFPVFWVIMWISGATNGHQDPLLNLILHLPVYPVELLLKIFAVPRGMAGMAWALPAIIMVIISAVSMGFIIGYGITYAIIRYLNSENDIHEGIDTMSEDELRGE